MINVNATFQLVSFTCPDRLMSVQDGHVSTLMSVAFLMFWLAQFWLIRFIHCQSPRRHPNFGMDLYIHCLRSAAKLRTQLHLSLSHELDRTCTVPAQSTSQHQVFCEQKYSASVTCFCSRIGRLRFDAPSHQATAVFQKASRRRGKDKMDQPFKYY